MWVYPIPSAFFAFSTRLLVASATLAAVRPWFVRPLFFCVSSVAFAAPPPALAFGAFTLLALAGAAFIDPFFTAAFKLACCSFFAFAFLPTLDNADDIADDDVCFESVEIASAFSFFLETFAPVAVSFV